MGMSEINVWVVIRRYDKIESENDNPQSNLHCFTIAPGLTLDDLKLKVYCWVGIESDNTKVLKFRQSDNNLIPLSMLSKGSQRDKPFIIDVVNLHQFCPTEERIIPPGYVDTLKSKLVNLEKRVNMAESSLPEVTSTHIQTVEATANQLANCVSFLDQRLDELAPQHWKAQLETNT